MNAGRHTSRRGRVHIAACSIGLAAAIGCGSYDVSDGRLTGIRHAFSDATEQGAYRCAPRELALAQAHLDFAQLELQQGDPRRAEQHMVEAETNVGAARLLSPPARCRQAGAAAPTVPVVSGGTESGDADGDGIDDASDRCPSAREDRDGFQDQDGCADMDNDADGVPDSADACVGESEDRDGFQDGDGCPERDNDGDGFDDPADDCPTEAGVPEDQGCPRKEYPGIVISEKEVRFSTPLQFAKGTATIRSVSMTALNSVVQALTDRPQLQIEIGAHSDSQGDDQQNMLLSQQQADAVMRYLTERGVASSRLTARGYGETRPIESNSTSRGRAINRRIELVRTDRVR